jgi:transposase
MRARLHEEQGLTVGLGTLWSFLDARDLTYKKRQLTPPNRIVPT